MAINWTKEQKAVIESRNRNLLVSAAAGSGKTAVLVERIIRMITEGENPLDIDQLLVMTFTKAAADEMRERVLLAVDEKLKEDPENGHLQMQAAMIPYARITTIDSFCLGIIREHYNQLDIDPAFRVGDEGELLLLRGSVMEQLLEDYYEAGDEEFSRFVETYATGKSDRGIEDHIMAVYNFSGKMAGGLRKGTGGLRGGKRRQAYGDGVDALPDVGCRHADRGILRPAEGGACRL